MKDAYAETLKSFVGADPIMPVAVGQILSEEVPAGTIFVNDEGFPVPGMVYRESKYPDGFAAPLASTTRRWGRPCRWRSARSRPRPTAWSDRALGRRGPGSRHRPDHGDAGGGLRHYYGDPLLNKQSGAPVVHRDGVLANYIANMANGTLDMDSIEVEVEHFFINDDAIAWDGWARLRLPGAVLVEAGAPLPDGGTVDDFYVLRSRQAIVIPFRDGLMVGEDFYLDSQGTWEKVS